MIPLPFLFPFILRLLGGRFKWLAHLLSYAIVIAAIGGAVYGAYCWAWDRGRDHERAEWNKEVAKVRKARTEAMQRASEADAKRAAEGAKPIIEKRKEIDNATANLPDQSPSARQRARGCAELRRQGRGC